MRQKIKWLATSAIALGLFIQSPTVKAEEVNPSAVESNNAKNTEIAPSVPETKKKDVVVPNNASETTKTEVTENLSKVKPEKTDNEVEGKSAFRSKDASKPEQPHDDVIEENGKQYYVVNGKKTSDVIATIDNKRYYFEPESFGSNLAKNKWSWSPTAQNWYFSDHSGKITKETENRNGKFYLKENGIQKTDTVLQINKHRYYFEPVAFGSNMARNKWSWSPTAQNWYFSDHSGKITKETENHNGKFYFKENNRLQSNSLIKINQNHYFFDSKGQMIQNVSAYDIKTNKWYQANSAGHIIKILTEQEKAIEDAAKELELTKGPVVYSVNDKTLRQAEVNLITQIAHSRNINPLFMITQLYHETQWGQHPRAISGRIDNNWAGITYPASGRLWNFAIPKTKGLRRAEGAYYVHYDTVSDFISDYAYLLRAGGNYNVAGATTLLDYVKGLFVYGGAKADYAWSGKDSKERYNNYLVAMERAYHQIFR